jgi:Uncharacterised nucleotidyltransferase
MVGGPPSKGLQQAYALREGEEIVRLTGAGGARVRLMGGIAIALRCQSARSPSPLARSFSDIDLCADRGAGPRLEDALSALGYESHTRFNALHGRTRMLFDRSDGVHVDVFVEEFAMCHRLPLAPRLTIHETTLSLADLLLTKLQVAELNRKDITDVTALLVDHPVSDDESGLNWRYLASVLGRDWGWWRTVTANLTWLAERLDGYLRPEEEDIVRQRLGALREASESAPKSLRWKARAKLGDRVPWRETPEDV